MQHNGKAFNFTGQLFALMIRVRYVPLALLTLTLASCTNKPGSGPSNDAARQKADHTENRKELKSASSARRIADAKLISARREVPVLCYHHIKDVLSLSRADKGYEVSTREFREQMKILSDSGYHSILPDQLYAYLAFGNTLPEKPFMLTFDDTDEEQYTVAKKEMDRYGFKGVYFIMTISINRPRYMSAAQIKQLSDEGHVIACHTWDHHMVTEYSGHDWEQQLDKPRAKLEEITGRPVEYFAYPYGIWSENVIPVIRSKGYKMAFQLSTKKDPFEPLFTVRRMVIDPDWSPKGVLSVMKKTFH